MKNIQELLELSQKDHTNLCPRQVLGVRVGLAGLSNLGFREPPRDKRLLIILETDGCFADGVIAATNCTVGRRTLRVEDYGKVAATFIDTKTGYSIRIVPAMDVRQKALAYASDEPRRYQAQMKAYQIMPDEEMFDIEEVHLTDSIESIVSKPGLRVNCELCGEEIMNEREINCDGLTLCRFCAGYGYYTSARLSLPMSVPCACQSPVMGSLSSAGDAPGIVP